MPSLPGPDLHRRCTDCQEPGSGHSIHCSDLPVQPAPNGP